MAINLIDVLLILFILLSALNGWRRGFILGLLDLLRWVGSLLLGLRFYQPVAHWLAPYVDLSDIWIRPVAYLLVVIVSGLLIHIAGTALVNRLPPSISRGAVNRVLGIFPGLLSGLISAAILAPLLMALPLPESIRQPTNESVIANRLAGATERIETAVAPIFDEALRQTLNMRTVEPESGETEKLPFKIGTAKPRPDLEAEMLVLVNQERAAVGLRRLAADPELTSVGRAHAKDMFERGYFGHVTPEGVSPFDRMHAAGVSFVIAGENLALAPTLSIAHNGLMHSPGHKANILRPQFGRVGIGVMDGGFRGLMISQEFRN